MKYTVLIIDDTQLIRTTIKNIFEDNNFQVVGTATNGEVGVALYQETKPDLVVLDIMMPVMDGIETLTKIIELDEKAKVLMCSTMNQQKLVVKAIEIGAKDFIMKPFYDEDLIKVAKLILE